MTAVNVTISAGATGYMLTDCAILYPDGKLQHIANKAISLPHARSVITSRGSVLFLHGLVARLQFSNEFDRIESRIGECARQALSSLPEDIRGDGGEVIMMGWSERRARVSAAVCRSANGFEPESSQGIIAPAVQLGHDFKSPQDYLLAAMEQQRRAYRTGAGSAVGGAAILTTLTKDTIIQQVLHRWPDEIGQAALSS